MKKEGLNWCSLLISCNLPSNGDSGGCSLLEVVDGDPEAFFTVRERACSLRRGQHFIVVIENTAPGWLRGIWRFVRRPKYISRMRTTLEFAGLRWLGAFAVYPDLRTATVVYQLNSPAAKYAEEQLIAGNRGVLHTWGLGLLTELVGSSPRVGADYYP